MSTSPLLSLILRLFLIKQAQTTTRTNKNNPKQPQRPYKLPKNLCKIRLY